MDIQKKVELANYILEREKIIEDSNTLDKTVQQAKKEIENIMMSLSLEEMVELDDYIMFEARKDLTN